MSRQLRRLVLTVFLIPFVACSAGRYAPDFTLRDDNANAWTLSQQRGKVVLLTFGYTHCADTCPATLAKLTRLRRSLGSGAEAVEIVFATVDPRRDTVAVLRRYVSHFRQSGESAVIGLTGTDQQITAIEGAYHVWSQRTGGRAYGVAHSSTIFLIDRDGRIRDLRDADDADAEIINAVSKLIA